jgi:hypothetical protein
MSSFFSMFQFHTSPAENADAQQESETMEDEPATATQLETQDTTESPLLQTQAAFHSSAPPSPQSNAYNFAEEAAAALAVPAPSDTNIRRLRSLSKLYTALPAKPLPTLREMVMDQMEYLMYVILLETNPARALQHKLNLEAVQKTFIELPNASGIKKSGRLYSRTHLTALACDIVIPHVDDAADTEHYEGELFLASKLTSDDWNSIREQLIFVKGILLRQDANAVVNPEGTAAPTSDFPDELLASTLMMTVEYDEVIRLLAVQQVLANLREKLQAIAEAEKNAESKNGMFGKSPSNDRSINKAVEKAVNAYIEHLSRIFPPNESEKVDEDDEVDDGIEIYDSDTNMPPTRISNIPTELNSFLLTDLYSPKQQQQRTTAAEMVDRLLEHMRSITLDTRTPALTQPGHFSYANVQQKVRV